MSRRSSALALAALAVLQSSCAITYRDAAGRNHYVGLMHVVTERSEEAWVTHTRSIGVTIERGAHCSSLSVGAASILRAAPAPGNGVARVELDTAHPFEAHLAVTDPAKRTDCATRP